MDASNAPCLLVRSYPLSTNQFSAPEGVDAGCCAIAAAVFGGAQVAITAERDGSIREWDVDTGRARRVLELGLGPVNDLTTMVISGEPMIVASGRDGVKFWSVVSGAPHRYAAGSLSTKLTGAHVVRMRGEPDLLLVSDYFGAIECWPNASMLAWRSLTGAGVRFGPLWSLTSGVSGDEPFAVACIDGRIQAIDLLWGRIISDVPVPIGPSLSMVTIRNAMVDYVAVTIGGDVLIVNPLTGDTVSQWSCGPSPLRRIAVLPVRAGVLLATISLDGTVAVWTPSGRRIAATQLPGQGAALAPAGRNTLVAGYVGGWGVLTFHE